MSCLLRWFPCRRQWTVLGQWPTCSVTMKDIVTMETGPDLATVDKVTIHTEMGQPHVYTLL